MKKKIQKKNTFILRNLMLKKLIKLVSSFKDYFKEPFNK